MRLDKEMIPKRRPRLLGIICVSSHILSTDILWHQAYPHTCRKSHGIARISSQGKASAPRTDFGKSPNTQRQFLGLWHQAYPHPCRKSHGIARINSQGKASAPRIDFGKSPKTQRQFLGLCRTAAPSVPSGNFAKFQHPARVQLQPFLLQKKRKNSFSFFEEERVAVAPGPGAEILQSSRKGRWVLQFGKVPKIDAESSETSQNQCVVLKPCLGS